MKKGIFDFKFQQSSLMYIASNGKKTKLSSEAGSTVYPCQKLFSLPLIQPAKLNREDLVCVVIDVNVVFSLNFEGVR